MENQSKILGFGFIAMLALSIGLVSPASAQSVDTQAEVTSETAVEVQENVGLEQNVKTSVESEVDVSNDEQDVPGAFGLFFQGVKERISLMFTFDPVKEAEKRMKFAEKRLEIAEKLARQGNNNENSARVERMMQRAHVLVEPVAQLDVNSEGSKEEFHDVVKNFADHQLKRQEVMDNIVAELSSEQVEALESVEVEGRQNFEAMLKVLDNENLPEEVKAHLTEVRARIQAHAEIMADMKEQKEELKAKIESGDDGAKEELKALHEEFRAKVKARQELRGEGQAEVDGDSRHKQEVLNFHLERLQKKADEGNEAAKKQLEALKARIESQIDARVDEQESTSTSEVGEDQAGSNVDVRGNGQIDVSL